MADTSLPPRGSRLSAASLTTFALHSSKVAAAMAVVDRISVCHSLLGGYIDVFRLSGTRLLVHDYGQPSICVHEPVATQ